MLLALPASPFSQPLSEQMERCTPLDAPDLSNDNRDRIHIALCIFSTDRYTVCSLLDKVLRKILWNLIYPVLELHIYLVAWPPDHSIELPLFNFFPADISIKSHIETHQEQHEQRLHFVGSEESPWTGVLAVPEVQVLVTCHDILVLEVLSLLGTFPVHPPRVEFIRTFEDLVTHVIRDLISEHVGALWHLRAIFEGPISGGDACIFDCVLSQYVTNRVSSRASVREEFG